jgi:hypothetical protein
MAAFRITGKAAAWLNFHFYVAHPIDYFTNAHFHLPTELTNEVLGAGFVDAEVFSIEGLVWLAADLRESWADAAKRQFLLEILRQTEQEVSILGASPHLLVYARTASENTSPATCRKSASDPSNPTRLQSVRPVARLRVQSPLPNHSHTCLVPATPG